MIQVDLRKIIGGILDIGYPEITIRQGGPTAPVAGFLLQARHPLVIVNWWPLSRKKTMLVDFRQQSGTVMPQTPQYADDEIFLREAKTALMKTAAGIGKGGKP